MTAEARLLSLLGMFGSGRSYSAQELAEHFDVTPRTIRRDIAGLRELGYVIGSAPGVSGGYRAQSRTVLPPLQLDTEEALATAVGLALLAGAGLSTANADSATRKLQGMLPAPMRTAVVDISTAVSVPQGHAPGVELETVIALASAITARTVATFDYRKRQTGDEAIEGRRVEPVHLVVLAAHWYLYAWDLARADWRVFRLDRMREVHVTTFQFTPRIHPDAEAAVTSAVTTAAYRYTVVLRADASAAAAEEWFPTRAATITGEAGGVRITFGVDDLRWAAIMTAATPGEVEILEPPELREEMRALGQRARLIGEAGKSSG